MLISIINILFTVYTLMLIVRVLGSWVPRFSDSRFMRMLAFYTDPYLNFFRKVIPPIGMLDLSPVFAFIILQVIQYIIILILS